MTPPPLLRRKQLWLLLEIPLLKQSFQTDLPRISQNVKLEANSAQTNWDLIVGDTIYNFSQHYFVNQLATLLNGFRGKSRHPRYLENFGWEPLDLRAKTFLETFKIRPTKFPAHR